METARKSKKRGFTVIELVISVTIIAILSGYTMIRYSKTRYKNAIDSDKVKIVTMVNNTNIEARFSTSPPKYIKFQDNGIIIRNHLGEMQYDKGSNIDSLKSKKVSTLFNCGEDNPVIKTCPLVVFYDSNQKNPQENPIQETIDPTELSDKAKRLENGYIELNNGSPEKSFTLYLFDNEEIARNRIKFKAGTVMNLEVYHYIGSENSSTALKRSNVAGSNPSENVTENENWKTEKISTNPLSFEIR